MDLFCSGITKKIRERNRVPLSFLAGAFDEGLEGGGAMNDMPVACQNAA